MLDKKEIRSLAIPAILYNITEPLIGLADTAIIGQLENHSTIAQGGVGLAAGLIATQYGVCSNENFIICHHK